MNPALLGWALSTLVFIGTLACLDFGFRMGSRSRHAAASDGIGAIEGAVFALLGLLLGFSFAGGIVHLDARRQLIVEEANNIGTAYLRLELLPPADGADLRPMFREYLDTRLRAYAKLPELDAAAIEFANAARMQQLIWSRAVAATRTAPTPATAMLLLPAINSMIDVTTARSVALHTHLPALIFVLLMMVAYLSALLAGYAMAKRRARSWLHMVVYALVTAITIYAVVDLDYPRAGFIRIGAADQALTQLRESIR
jgi:hypothetical protein